MRTANASSLSVELNGDRVDGGVDVDDSAFFSPGDWVEARAVAIGGRPRPTLKWTVDGKEPGSQYKYVLYQQTQSGGGGGGRGGKVTTFLNSR